MKLKITGLTKVNFDGKEGITLKEYASAKAKKLGLKGETGEALVKEAIKSISKDGYEYPEDAKMASNIKKVGKSVEADLEKSQEEREAAKAKKEADKAAADDLAKKRKDEASKAFESATSKSLAVTGKALDTAQKAVFSKTLGGGFSVENGNIVLNKDNPTTQDFATAFAALEGYVSSVEEIAKGLLKLEAQLAIIAEEKYGADWPNFFSASPKRVLVIRKNMAMLKTVGKLGVELETDNGPIGLGVARAMLEANISKGEDDSEEKNLEFKKEVLEEYIEKSNEAGRNLTADEARVLVNEKKNKVGITAKVQYKYAYVFANDEGKTVVIASNDRNPAWIARAFLVIDRALNRVSFKDNDIVVNPILPPNEKQSQFIASLGIEVEKKKEEPKAAAPADKGKKGKKEEPKAEPKKEEKKEDDDDDLNFDLGSDDSADADETKDEDGDDDNIDLDLD